VNPKFGRLRSRLILALGSLIATTCFAREPLDTVRDCATVASPSVYGLKNLAAVCPELQAALGALGLDQILYQGWQDKLSVHALRDVLDLSERYSTRRRQGAPDTIAVPGILQALQNEQAPQAVSWWHAFTTWIKQWLEHSDSPIAKWIKQIFDRISDSTHVSPAFLQAFVYIVTALTALAAIFVIARELKAAGIGRSSRRARTALNSQQNPSIHPPTDAATCADENTPAGLLRALVGRLIRTGRLRSERSLTHRELITSTYFDSDAQKTIFAAVARTAETILYGSESAAPEIVDSVTRQGRRLLQQLSVIARPP
jgi:hypothetical protein